MPRSRGETIYVLRYELREVCDEVDALKGSRKPLPWYFVLASGGASLALAGLLGLFAYAGASKDEKPPDWLRDVYGTMLLVGGTSAIILFIVGLLAKNRYDREIEKICAKIRGLEYSVETDASV